jgi:hypothetical protein
LAYKGKNNQTATWRDVGMLDNSAITLSVFEGGDSSNNLASAYLYRAIRVENDRVVTVLMGSDDGMRCWLNNELIIDADTPRGLDPNAHRVQLKLKAGVNHLLCKVGQGRGTWQYQITTRSPLSSEVDARLLYQLSVDFPSREDPHYLAMTIPIPEEIILEVGGLDVLPDGRAAVCTRRGDVWLIGNIKQVPPLEPTFTRFASGLHEPLGLAVRVEDGKPVIYCTQRSEVTRLVDEDGDDRADVYETFCDQWGVSGNYHEFAFGPKFDPQGNAWVTLNVGFCDSLGKSIAPYRGWAVKISPAGSMTPVCDGLRSPNGIGFNREGEPFYVDNQGDFVGTCRMTHMSPGSWHGHPASLRWRDAWKEGQEPPERQRASVWFPYIKAGQSTADIALCEQNGRFGPFDGQLFCGDQTRSMVLRVDLEQIDGFWQGAVFPFREGLDCGVNRVAFDATGNMIVGQTDRGWGSTGRRRFGVQRIVYSGQTPFEVLTMRAAPNGFVLTFTEDVDRASVAAVIFTGFVSISSEP